MGNNFVYNFNTNSAPLPPYSLWIKSGMSTENLDMSGFDLRKWLKDKIELKNSWGIYTSDRGNFSVTDLKYLICTNRNKLVFISLMFDYNNLSTEYKNRINVKLCEYWKTFDNTLETISDDEIYKGDCKNGFRNGKGVLIVDTYYYIGDWKYGFRNGVGKIELISGDKYNGEWKYDLKSGHGIMTYSLEKLFQSAIKTMSITGIISENILDQFMYYDGNWENDEKNGKGKMIYYNGNIYEGNWKNDEKSGHGKMTYCNNSVDYNGIENDTKLDKLNEYLENQLDNLNNNSIEIDKKCDIYEGNWENDKKNGYGKMTYSDGTIYEGEWENDEKKIDSITSKKSTHLKKYIKYKNKYLYSKK